MNYEIVSIYLKDGRNATGLSGKSGAAECCVGSYEPYAIMMGCQNNGDRAMMVFDLAADSKEEAVNLDKLRLLCRDGAIPVYAAGEIENIEKIKRYLGRGCEKVFLNFRSACGKKLLEEAAGMFGREKLGWYMETPEEVPENGVIPEKEVSMLLLEPAAACVKDRTKLPVLLHEEKRAVCTADNVPAHIYQSAVSWGEFKKNGDGLVPVVVQDYKNNEVLMVAYMNQEAFEATCRTGRMTYWSRSRRELWVKGLTSGHFQFVRSLTLDCDNDTILAQVAQIGAACHTGHRSCFFQQLIRTDGECRQDD